MQHGQWSYTFSCRTLNQLTNQSFPIILAWEKKGPTTEEERIDNCLVYLDLRLCVCVCETTRVQYIFQGQTEEEVSLRLFIHFC